MKSLLLKSLLLAFSLHAAVYAQHPFAADNITSLTNSKVKYVVPEEHDITLQTDELTAIIVDNSAVDTPELPRHRAGYNGIASLKHRQNDINLFVPALAGLNFEHIHDGIGANLKHKFEPRHFPMELRVIDDRTVELYQAPTENFRLESCGRYHLREDGTIEYTFECIPRGKTFEQGYIGLFWASYINAPGEPGIEFMGRHAGDGASRRILSRSPKHGVEAVHARPKAVWRPIVDRAFPLSLVANFSFYEYVEPWYSGTRDGLVFTQSFDWDDQIFFVQSPSGGGNGNPAWDFEWFIPNYNVGQAYGFTMQATYAPVELSTKRNP